MQNLRDKLLKAGLVDRRRKKKIEHQQRLERQARDAAARRREEEQREIERQQAFLQRQEQKRRADRERQQQLEAERRAAAERQAAARRAAEQARLRQAEQQRRLEQARRLARSNMFLPAREGPVSFYFVSRSGAIRHLQLSTRLAQELAAGLLAICQLPSQERLQVGLVRRDVARQLQELDPSLVRFWVEAGGTADLAPLPPLVDDGPPPRRRRVASYTAGGPAGERRER